MRCRGGPPLLPRDGAIGRTEAWRNSSARVTRALPAEIVIQGQLLQIDGATGRKGAAPAEVGAPCKGAIVALQPGGPVAAVVDGQPRRGVGPTGEQRAGHAAHPAAAAPTHEVAAAPRWRPFSPGAVRDRVWRADEPTSTVTAVFGRCAHPGSVRLRWRRGRGRPSGLLATKQPTTRDELAGAAGLAAKLMQDHLRPPPRAARRGPPLCPPIRAPRLPAPSLGRGALSPPAPRRGTRGAGRCRARAHWALLLGPLRAGHCGGL